MPLWGLVTSLGPAGSCSSLFFFFPHRVFPGGSVVKNLPPNVGSIPESGSSPREGNGNSLQYSCLENPMDRETWQATVYGVTHSQTQLKRLSSSSQVILMPVGSEGKASACNAGDLGSIPGSGRSPGEGNGNPTQYSCLENPMDRETW